LLNPCSGAKSERKQSEWVHENVELRFVSFVDTRFHFEDIFHGDDFTAASEEPRFGLYSVWKGSGNRVYHSLPQVDLS